MYSYDVKRQDLILRVIAQSTKNTINKMQACNFLNFFLYNVLCKEYSLIHLCVFLHTIINNCV